jgi:phosphoserine phosphatase
MSSRTRQHTLSVGDLEAILDVTRALASPFDLMTMLAEVVNAAKQVLKADRGSVWLYDASNDELVLEVATGLPPVRVPASVGLVGACARSREIINVPDCYGDPRFDPRVDRESGYHTRCLLTLPLVDHQDVLVGVMQLLNKVGGAFDADDEGVAVALAAQCAVALQRVRMTEALLEGERLHQELEMARVVQMSTLPSAMPSLQGYDVFGVSMPAEETGGDTFDLQRVDRGLLAVLADAAGHGIAPALSITQMQAMLRMAFRLGADLQTAFAQVNDELAEMLPPDRFITAFIGVLDPIAHRVDYQSGGQGPILHFHAATASCTRHGPTSFPLGAMPIAKLRPAPTLELQPGDILVLLSDGVYEYQDPRHEEFGDARVEAIVAAHAARPMAELASILDRELRAFARGAPQQDDVTMVLIKRTLVTAGEHRYFERRIDALDEIVAFTAGAFGRQHVDPKLLPDVEFAVEELFTNMVKYGGTSAARVRLDIAGIPAGVEVTLTDEDVEPFDVTQAPDADVSLPIGERAPGGLGLHLTRRLVDAVEYDYSEAARRSRITFRKTVPDAPPRPAKGGGEHADD